MATSGIIQTPKIAGPSIDQQVEAVQITQTDGTVVLRQTVTTPDTVKVGNETLQKMLIEMRVTNYLLAHMLSGATSVEDLSFIREDIDQEFAGLN